MPAFDVQAFLQATVDERINILTSVPAIFWLAMSQPNFAEFDVSNVRWVTYGGAPTAPDVIARLRASFPNARLGNGFGLTETSSVSTFLPDEYAEVRPETVGFTAPPVEVDLLDADPDDGRRRAADPRAEHRGRILEQAASRPPRRSSTAGCTPATWPASTTRASSRSSIARRTWSTAAARTCTASRSRTRWSSTRRCSRWPCSACPTTMMGEKVGAVIVPRPGTDPDPPEIRAFVKAQHRRLQGAAVHLVPRRSAAAQRRRQGAQARAAQGGRVG